MALSLYMNAGPDTTLAKGDPGDETLRRYDFQKAYAAIVALELLKKDTKTIEVFCEQFEDVLVKLENGKFVGIQVKTKDLNLGAFSSGDEPIVKSLTRFVELELSFPGYFERYTIATNTGFSEKPFKHTNIKYLIELAKKGNKEDLIKNYSLGKKIITKISETCACEVDVVISVLAKLSVHPKFANLEKAHLNVIDELRQIDIAKGQTYGVLESISERLYTLISKASGLSECGNDVSVYLKSESSEDAKITSIIEGKRIGKIKLQELIQKEIENPVSLFLKDKPRIADMPRTEGKLVVKMDAGKISSDNVSLAKDHKYSAEAYLISWLHKQSSNSADKKYNQIRLAVKTECIEAYDDERTNDSEFGEAMLKNIRNRLRNRRREEPKTFFECDYEHLMGMVGILTEDCEVWWSEKFEIE